MAVPVHVLIEEPFEVLARGFGDGFDKVAGGGGLECALPGVVLDGLPEAGVAELAADHVEHPAALVIDVRISGAFILAILRDDRSLERITDDGALLGALAPLKEVAAFGMFLPERGEVGGEALVE